MDHKLNIEQYEAYEQIIRDVIEGKKSIPITHVLSNTRPTRFMPIHRKLDLSKTMPYQRRNNTYKPELHWGQLKLFLSEVEFLTKVVQEAGDREVVFVYAGAAPGHHIAYLHTLFPKMRFELYDPNDFVIKDTDLIKTHVQFFTDVDAKEWADYFVSNPDKYLAFCSDIRTEPATQENIIRNMNMQLKWWQIMGPELSMFKFRLPWEEGQTEYPDGELMIQAYPGPTSSETRLICRKGALLRNYDNKKYEDACYYHNYVTRNQTFQTALGCLNLQRDGLDMCYDCASFIHVMLDYMKVMTLPLTGLRKLLSDVQHEISFGKSSVLKHSKKYFTNTFDKFRKMSYIPCQNKLCLVCTAGDKFVNPIARGISRATIENEEAFMNLL